MRLRHWTLTAAALAAVSAVGAGAVWARRNLFAVTVEGHSMSPALEPGDKILMRRGTRDLGVGALVVVARPDEITGWTAGAVLDTDLSVADRFVKRVAAVAGDRYPAALRRGGVVPHGHIVVLGDHPHSVDSKQYGPCPLDQVLGVEARIPGRGRAKLPDRPLPSSPVRHNRRMSGIPDLLPDDHTGEARSAWRDHGCGRPRRSSSRSPTPTSRATG